MKKQYITPKAESIGLHFEGLIANSLTSSTPLNPNNQMPDPGDAGTQKMNFGSDSSWDF